MNGMFNFSSLNVVLKNMLTKFQMEKYTCKNNQKILKEKQNKVELTFVV